MGSILILLLGNRLVADLNRWRVRKTGVNPGVLLARQRNITAHIRKTAARCATFWGEV